ncbi:MAG: YheV family putative metal-binding protein [Luminiphilus sp.]
MSDSGSEPNQRPRFVAGAVCPSCQEMDRMVIDGAADERRCIACGFVEARPDAGTSMPATRVTRAAARRVETEAEAVRLLDE